MTRPLTGPEFATDATFATGDETGDATRVDPGASVRARGFLPNRRVPAKHANFIHGTHGDWLAYLDAKLNERQACNWSLAANDFVVEVDDIVRGAHYYTDEYGFGFWILFGDDGETVPDPDALAWTYPNRTGIEDYESSINPLGGNTVQEIKFCFSKPGAIILGGTINDTHMPIARSADNGVSYAKVSVHSGSSLQPIGGCWDEANDTMYVFSEDDVLASGTSLAWRSTDDGATWTTLLGILPEDSFTLKRIRTGGGVTVFILDSAGTQLRLLHSADGGDSFDYTLPAAFGGAAEIFDLVHDAASDAWIMVARVASVVHVFYSVDGCVTWTNSGIAIDSTLSSSFSNLGGMACNGHGLVAIGYRAGVISRFGVLYFTVQRAGSSLTFSALKTHTIQKFETDLGLDFVTYGGGQFMAFFSENGGATPKSAMYLSEALSAE